MIKFLRKYIRIDSPFKTDYTVKEQIYFGIAIGVCLIVLNGVFGL